ncbi:hypothetical protein GOBAR_DD17446 [Gossypium barbadense]|nr:hypothetical protein GOBAR_DD17446 [Gossypium barbadense]
MRRFGRSPVNEVKEKSPLPQQLALFPELRRSCLCRCIELSSYSISEFDTGLSRLIRRGGHSMRKRRGKKSQERPLKARHKEWESEGRDPYEVEPVALLPAELKPIRGLGERDRESS